MSGPEVATGDLWVPNDLDYPVFDPTAPLPSSRLLIEASAGTGKTYTISTLAVRFVAEHDDVGAAGLCVVSFTEAATAELRSRIRQRMVDVADLVASGVPTTDELANVYRDLPEAGRAAIVERLRRASDEFDRATITTIHGFCSRVLSALGAPVGAVGSGGDEVNEVVNDLLLTTARSLAAAPPPDGEDHDDGDGGPGDATTLVPQQFRDVVNELVRLPLATADVDAGPLRGAGSSGGGTARLAEAVAVTLEARRLVADRRRQAAVRSFDSLLTDVRDLLDPRAGATDATRQAVRTALAHVRVVMVDEFQDTDGLQWAIFDNAFPLGTCPMVLVGDPKQSIYRFRSAEVSTYLLARASEGMEVVTLGTNFRSDPGVLTGIERLYLASGSGAPYPLGSDPSAVPSVHFRPVAAHHEGRRLHGMARPQSVEVRVLASPAADKIPSALRRAQVANDVAWEVSHLLRATEGADEWGGEGGVSTRTAVRIDDPEAPGGRRDLRPSDIAVLVRTNDQAVSLAHRLARSGIAAATATTSSVLDGAAAWQWRLLLAALARPAAPGPARAAALGWFLGLPAAELVGPAADLAPVHELLARWASVLRRRGPMAVLTEARRNGLADRLLVHTGGERRITDLEHIAELLQGAAGTRPVGALEIAGLLDELAEGGDTETAVDQMARRIDRDDEAVQIFTVHRAKGLEFPVVLCPYLWVQRKMDGVPHAALPDGRGGSQRQVWAPLLVGQGYPAAKSSAARFGAFALPTRVSRGGQSTADRVRLEQLEEMDRLVYVALTRAAAHLVVWWTSPADASGRRVSDQALARLLHHATGVPTDELVATPSAVGVLDGEQVAVETITVGAPEPSRARRPGAVDLERARYTRSADQRWHRWSYSRLSDHLGDRPGPGQVRVGSPDEVVALDPEEGRGGGTDEVVRGDAADLPATLPSGSPPAPWVRDPFGPLGGARFGTMVHGVLEHLDFTAPTLANDLSVALGDAMAHWRDAALAPDVASGLLAALGMPLGGPVRASDSRLVTLPPSHRLNELRFDLRLGPTTLGDVVRMLAADPAVAEPYGPWLAGLGDPGMLEGMLTGSIDLVGTFDAEQYWVADYKTNRLPGGYGPAQSVAAMAHHNYPLQATIYLVALHRFLSQRLAGYEPSAT